jgi:hypothetical protein
VSRRRRRGPRPGDRLPDAVVHRGGTEIWLQEALSAPAFHLLLCGADTGWDDAAVEDLRRRHAPFLTVHRLIPAGGPGRADGSDLRDVSGSALSRLGVRGRACLVVRPDGHIGYRADDVDLSGADTYLRRWLTGISPPDPWRG